MRASVFGVILTCVVLIEGQSVYWPCGSDAECSSVVPGTHCTATADGRTCECAAGFVFSADVSQCLRQALYGEACTDVAQCSHMLTGAICDTSAAQSVCTCREGLTYLQGRCRTLAPLLSDCQEDVDCFFGYDRESVICRSNKCECASGFYQRSDNICRRILLNIGDVCTVNADCQGGENHVCSNGRCQESAQTRTLGVQTSIDQSSSRSLNKSIGTNTSFVIDIEGRDAFGDDCTTTGVECDGLPHSVCRRGKCHCQPGYYPSNSNNNNDRRCYAELGERTEDPDLCATVYRDGKCVCNLDQFYMPNMRSCIKSVAQHGAICTQQSQCSPFGQSYCHPTSPRRCTCRDYAVYDDRAQMCVKRTGLGRYCDRDGDCDGLPNTSCDQVRNMCACKESYVEDEGGQCRAGIGAGCAVDNDCLVENTECVTGEGEDEGIETAKEEEEEVEEEAAETLPQSDQVALLLSHESTERRQRLRRSVTIGATTSSGQRDVDSPTKQCQCKVNYVRHENVCLEKADEFEGDCIETEQCQPLLGEMSRCVDGKCVCADQAHHNYGKCNEAKALGESCAKVSECYVTENREAVQCRNALCQCDFSHVADADRKKCIPSGKGSSNRPSPLKIITLLLISAAVFVTSAAIRDAVLRSSAYNGGN